MQQAKEGRKRGAATISQFSIDELLKHDDKRTKLEPGDSKATPFDEVEVAEGAAESAVVVKQESEESEGAARGASCLALALAGGSRHQETLRTASPR